MSWGEVKKINSNMNVPLNEGGVKIVKSVQRGVGTATSLIISSVNAGKSILLIDGIVTTTGYDVVTVTTPGPHGQSVSGIRSMVNGGATLASLTDDLITMTDVKNKYSWQLIEFY